MYAAKCFRDEVQYNLQPVRVMEYTMKEETASHSANESLLVLRRPTRHTRCHHRWM